MTKKNMEQFFSNNPLSYRSILTIPRDVRFGLELELENVSCKRTSILVRSNLDSSWTVKEDQSLKKNANAEIAMPPLLNVRDTWVTLKKLGQLLARLKPTYDNCSLQVNLDGSLLPSDEDKIKFLKLYAVYEDIIYRFSQGEDGTFRDSLEDYAYPIILNIKACKEFERDILDVYTNQKRYGICFKNKDVNLIEFRTPNATINPVLWQNYITFFYYLVMYSVSSNCSLKELEEYIDRFNKTYILESYELLRVDKAFDLAQKIFKKQEDQSYFLQQYIGRK